MSINSQSLRQRRRRVAMDQNQSANDAATVSSGRDDAARQVSARPYTEGARRSRQFKTTDFIPKRRWPLSAVAIALILAIVALNGIQYAIPSMEVAVGPAVASAFSLESQQGLSTWYCNLLSLLSAAACIQIYLLRQHRRDDYRGIYRVWLWYAAVFVVASMVSVTSISEVFSQVCHKLAVPNGSTAYWPTLILFTALTVLVVRGYFEIRRSRLAVVALATVFLTGAGVLILQLMPELASDNAEVVPTTHGNLVLLATSSLLFGTIGYARYVYLEANGLLRVASDSESRAARKSARAANKKAAKDKRKSDRESKRQQPVDRNVPDSRKDQNESDAAFTTAGSPKAGVKASKALLSQRSERNSGRSDNRVGSGQKLEQRTPSKESDDAIPPGLSKSELRRLRKQKRRAA